MRIGIAAQRHSAKSGYLWQITPDDRGGCPCERDFTGWARQQPCGGGETPVPASGQGAEIAAAIGLDKAAHGWGRDHLDLVAPLVEMPGHLEPARRVEPHNQTAIGLRFQHLLRMEAEARGAAGGPRGKAPDHLAVLRRILPDAKGLRGVFGDREPVLQREAFVERLCLVVA